MPVMLCPLLKLELKHHLDSLKYVFLGPKETLSIMISSCLCFDQQKELIHVLSKHKGTLGWLVADLKRISPAICLHRIHLEEMINLLGKYSVD